jgi:hypothetical protein
MTAENSIRGNDWGNKALLLFAPTSVEGLKQPSACGVGASVRRALRQVAVLGGFAY